MNWDERVQELKTQNLKLETEGFENEERLLCHRFHNPKQLIPAGSSMTASACSFTGVSTRFPPATSGSKTASASAMPTTSAISTTSTPTCSTRPSGPARPTTSACATSSSPPN